MQLSLFAPELKFFGCTDPAPPIFQPNLVCLIDSLDESKALEALKEIHQAFVGRLLAVRCEVVSPETDPGFEGEDGGFFLLDLLIDELDSERDKPIVQNFRRVDDVLDFLFDF